MSGSGAPVALHAATVATRPPLPTRNARRVMRRFRIADRFASAVPPPSQRIADASAVACRAHASTAWERRARRACRRCSVAHTPASGRERADTGCAAADGSTVAQVRTETWRVTMDNDRRWSLCLVLLAVGCAPGAVEDEPSSAEPAALSAVSSANRWGFNDDSGIAGGVNGSVAARLAREAGFGWTRYSLYWDVANPAAGQYNWTVSDRAIAALIDAGMNVYVSIMWAPAWTTGGLETYVPFRCMDPVTTHFDPNRLDGACRDSKPDTAAFRTFVRAAIQRYRARYGDRIKHWGFWNETEYGV